MAAQEIAITPQHVKSAATSRSPTRCDLEDLQLHDAVEQVVNGLLSTESAARTVDGVITSQAERYCRAFEAGEDVASADARDAHSGVKRFTWLMVAQVGAVVPHDHPGQDRAVGLLEEMKVVARGGYPSVAKGEAKRKSVSLWGEGGDGLERAFDKFTASLDEKEASDKDATLRNIDAFKTRLKQAGLI